MTFSITLFVLSWICFLLFADKKQFFEIAPTCYLAMYCASIFSMITKVFPYWTYLAPNKVCEILRDLLHDFGVYPIITYLFLQTLPIQQTVFSIVKHILYFSLVGIGIEVVAVKTGNMIYGLGWNTWISYAMDWGLFVLFYGHHKWREKHTGGSS